MNKIKMVAEKLALVTVSALPLTSLADLVTPAWDERVLVPACNMPEWLFIVGFSVASVVLFVVMRRKGVSFMMFFVHELVLAAAIVTLVAHCSRHMLFFEERVIHHPESRPNHYDGKIQVKCRKCGKEYTATVSHYSQREPVIGDRICYECRTYLPANRHGTDLP